MLKTIVIAVIVDTFLFIILNMADIPINTLGAIGVGVIGGLIGCVFNEGE